MIDSREQLIHVLTEAAEVEHNLLCSYLYAAFSLKRPGEGGLTDDQGHATSQWRKVIVSVALEEMAHLACVNNLLVAIGGAPHFDRPNLPVSPGYHPAGVVVRLTPFDAATLDHFIFLERPVTRALRDAEGFEPAAAARAPARRPITPTAIDYDTIGELYDALAEGFSRLSARLGESVLIDADGRGQLGPEAAQLPDVRVVRTLSDALGVIETIKEQGEGSSGSHEDSHFDRFEAIKTEWATLLVDDPDFEPSWLVAHDPVMRRPLAGADRVWITQPEAAAYLDVGNAAYGFMLSVLQQVFGIEDAREQACLMRAAVELMEVTAAVGNALARMPATLDPSGPHAGLSFTVPRILGFRPRMGRDQLRERVGELYERAKDVLEDSALEKAHRRFASALTALGEGGASDRSGKVGERFDG